MPYDDIAQGFARLRAMIQFRMDAEWLLNPYRPFWERFASQFDDEERLAIAQTFQGIVEQLRREIN